MKKIIAIVMAYSIVASSVVSANAAVTSGNDISYEVGEKNLS